MESEPVELDEGSNSAEGPLQQGASEPTPPPPPPPPPGEETVQIPPRGSGARLGFLLGVQGGVGKASSKATQAGGARDGLPPVAAGEKRPFGDLDDDEDDVFASKKGKTKVKESAPGAATGMILSLRESLQNCKENLESNQVELEAAKSEIQKWHSAFQNIPAVPAGTNPEPVSVVTYVSNLKSSEESLKEQLEKAKKREAAFIVTFAKREQEIAELKSAVRDLKTQLRPPSMQTRRLLLDPAIHEEFTRLKNLAEEKEKKIKELQDNVAAVNFTPSSKHGKMLMAKCRTLQEENEEIGTMASEGKIHELGMKIAVLKTQNNELRNQFDGLYKHMDGLTNDVERSNEMVSILQEELEAKDVELARLKEMLSQKEAAEDTAVEEIHEAADEMNASASSPQPIKIEA